MTQVVDSKLKLLYLVDILKRETDENHGISTQEIISKLAERSIHVERKTVYRDLECLRAYGLKIAMNEQRRPTRYRLVNRDFTDQELFFLADAIQSSQFLTKNESAIFTEKIRALGSKYMADSIKKNIHVEGRIKNASGSVYKKLDTIQRIIDGKPLDNTAVLVEGEQTDEDPEKYKIEFKYYKYNEYKKPIIQHGGNWYSETPVQLAYMNGRYYLITWNDKYENFTSYRVDRMRDIRKSKAQEKATRNDRIAKFDIGKWQERAFDMFSGESRAVTLAVKPELMSSVIDCFGLDVEAIPQQNGWVHIHVTIMDTPTFYSWLTGFGTDIKILSPSDVRKNYIVHLKKIIESYQENYQELSLDSL